uniref:Uncharacterized protein n=1 Tax=Glossina palpalis gambiensis TaxID=67801 RepID=A0A1B0C0U3_9MUSC
MLFTQTRFSSCREVEHDQIKNLFCFCHLAFHNFQPDLQKLFTPILQTLCNAPDSSSHNIYMSLINYKAEDRHYMLSNAKHIKDNNNNNNNNNKLRRIGKCILRKSSSIFTDDAVVAVVLLLSFVPSIAFFLNSVKK